MVYIIRGSIWNTNVAGKRCRMASTSDTRLLQGGPAGVPPFIIESASPKLVVTGSTKELLAGEVLRLLRLPLDP